MLSFMDEDSGEVKDGEEFRGTSKEDTSVEDDLGLPSRCKEFR